MKRKNQFLAGKKQETLFLETPEVYFIKLLLSYGNIKSLKRFALITSISIFFNFNGGHCLLRLVFRKGAF